MSSEEETERYRASPEGIDAKKAEAFRIAFARRSSAFSRFNRFTSGDSSDVIPGCSPWSTSTSRTQCAASQPR